MISQFNTFFPLWAIVFSTMAYLYPQFFSSLSHTITYLLMAIMLFMGMTLSSSDFLRALKRPKICQTVAIEVGMQNSGLAVALALKYFPPISALPEALLASYRNQKKSNI
ncbi:MAG: hypothetical protein Q8N01_07150 [Sulfuricurvum sp.]|nr:hypothetical protein [Sulfuricurvum sp.]